MDAVYEPSPSARQLAKEAGLSVREFVYRVTRSRITTGELAPGSRVTEQRLATELGISRTPVREVIMRLVSEKLLTQDAGHGYIVPTLGVNEIDEIYVVRNMLERHACEQAAERISNVELSQLELTHQTMAEAVESGDRNQTQAAMLHFHDIVYAAAGNSVLWRIGKELIEDVARHSVISSADAERLASIVGEHYVILEAIKRRDPSAAARASDAHTWGARNYVIGHRLRNL